MKNNSPWKKVASKVIFKNPWISLRQDEVITPAGKHGSYTLLEAKPFVIVVAIDANKLIMIKQSRYPINKTIIEFPAGGIEASEDFLAAAKRELKEETGYEADRWTYVGKFYELVSISQQEGHLFIAQSLRDTGSHRMREEGISESFSVDINQFEDMMLSGEIIDALTPAAFYKVKLYLESKNNFRSSIVSF